MIIASVMTRNPLYVRPEMTVTEVRELMTKEKVGKLPVLDKHDNLVGIVTKKDLVNAGPSAATTLDMYEISYLLSKLKVEKVMAKNVVTVKETEVVEEAATFVKVTFAVPAINFAINACPLFVMISCLNSDISFSYLSLLV